MEAEKKDPPNIVHMDLREQVPEDAIDQEQAGEQQWSN